MSAFMCNNDHISAIALHAVTLLEFRKLTVINIGKILYEENLKSVKYRYQDPDDDETPPFRLTAWAAKQEFSPVQILKAAHCLRYQSCEHPDFEKSKAHHIIESVIDDAISKLPGYSTAQWEIQKKHK